MIRLTTPDLSHVSFHHPEPKFLRVCIHTPNLKTLERLMSVFRSLQRSPERFAPNNALPCEVHGVVARGELPCLFIEDVTVNVDEVLSV